MLFLCCFSLYAFCISILPILYFYYVVDCIAWVTICIVKSTMLKTMFVVRPS